MTARIELLALVLTALASGVAGYSVARRWTEWRTVWLFAGSALVAWPIVTHILPERLQFLYPSFPGGDLLFAGAFLWVGVLSALFGHSSRLRVLTAVLGVGLVYFVMAAPIHLALDGERIRALHLRIDDGVTLQAESYTCVPSALATVLRQWGHEFTEGELAYALRSSFQGTSPVRVPAVVARLPLHPPLAGRVLSTSYDELARLDLPVILIGKTGSIRHAVALLELDGDTVTLGDPLRGRVTASRKTLGREFEWSGVAILIRPVEKMPQARPRLAPVHRAAPPGS